MLSYFNWTVFPFRFVSSLFLFWSYHRPLMSELTDSSDVWHGICRIGLFPLYMPSTNVNIIVLCAHIMSSSSIFIVHRSMIQLTIFYCLLYSIHDWLIRFIRLILFDSGFAIDWFPFIHSIDSFHSRLIRFDDWLIDSIHSFIHSKNIPFTIDRDKTTKLKLICN